MLWITAVAVFSGSVLSSHDRHKPQHRQRSPTDGDSDCSMTQTRWRNSRTALHRSCAQSAEACGRGHCWCPPRFAVEMRTPAALWRGRALNSATSLLSARTPSERAFTGFRAETKSDSIGRPWACLLRLRVRRRVLRLGALCMHIAQAQLHGTRAACRSRSCRGKWLQAKVPRR